MSQYGMRPVLDVENKAIIMRVVDKDAEEFVAERSFSIADIHESLRPNVMLYGGSKLLSDRTSDVKLDEVGPEAKLDEMSKVWDQFAKGEWARERKAGTRTVRIEVEALAILSNCTVGEMQGSLARYSEEQRAQIFANPEVVAKAAELRAAREGATEGPSLDAYIAA